VKVIQKTIEVYRDGPVQGEFCTDGRTALPQQRKWNFSFQDHPDWLKREEPFEFDPDLQIVAASATAGQSKGGSTPQKP
jgi:hypothetical protein